MARNQAIVIGINRYEFLQPLNYATRDALAMQEFFKQQAGFERVWFFADDSPDVNGKSTKPTLVNLQRMLRQVFETPFLGDGDNFWFFFSGHGVPHYLMAADSDPEDVARFGIATSEISDRLRRCGADNVVMILDACRKGGR
ncbi:caspase family protein, partial [filamentous cyanobacterium LEGE 11480]